jgi:GH24 family phage-related lysozyme (muramidase)
VLTGPSSDTGSTVAFPTVTAVPPDTSTTTTPTVTTSPPGGRGGELEQNPNCSSPTRSVDNQFISDREGGQQLTGYVPSGNSGVTIATGIDLNGRTQSSMSELGWPQSLIDQLLPYCSVTGEDAKALIARSPLTITTDQANLMDNSVMQKTYDRLANAYDGATTFTDFDRLPSNTQTALADLAYQYGDGSNLAVRAPNFWSQITSGDWTGAIQNLRNFGDDFSTRRNAEADLIQKDVNSYVMPTSDNPCT